MPECTIVVKKPAEPALPPVIDELFDRSCAIGQAVGEFWERGLASAAELGGVEEYDDRYEVTIRYHSKQP